MTAGVTNTQSYSLVIRDVFFDALAADPFFTNHFKRKTKMVPVQAEQVPYLGVYIIDETMAPDGEANQPPIKFQHTLRIGFSVMYATNDQDSAEASLDASFWKINNVLLTNQYIMNLFDTSNPYTYGDQYAGNPDNVVIESVTRGVRRHLFGHNQLINQTPLAELQYDMSVFGRSMWYPTITDDLNEIDLTTGVKYDDTQADMANRLQAGGHWDMTVVPASQNKSALSFRELLLKDRSSIGATDGKKSN
jgi:hypothetical protein